MRRDRYPGAAAAAAFVVVVGLGAPRSSADDPPPAKGKGGQTEKIEVLTEAKLIGRWEGKNANGSVAVSFHARDKGKDYSFSAMTINVNGRVTVAAAYYTIDAVKNEVQFPNPQNGLAKPTKDGALEISGTFTLGGNTYTVPKTLLTRSKEDPQ